jgi:hypothetical protein
MDWQVSASYSMAAKPVSSETPPPSRKIPEPPNDGFPGEKDVSTPPPGTDQAEDRPDHKDGKKEK